jgi:hypothetical protein
MESTDGKQLNKLSPFIIAKTIDMNAGSSIAKVSPLRSGALLLQTSTKLQTDNLVKIKDFVGIPVEVKAHGSLNHSRGVIRCSSLQYASDEETLAALMTQGVNEIRRITTTRNGIRTQTSLVILTFDTPKPPNTIKVGYESVEVETYYPNPLRCTRCQHFGHHHSRCDPKKAPTCSVCGEKDHISTPEHPCRKDPKCTNCSGNHPSYHRECPAYTKEKQVMRIKTEENISIPEARKRVNATPTWNTSTTFAQAARPKATLKVSAGTQCDDLLPNIPPLIKIQPLPQPSNHNNTEAGMSDHNKPDQNGAPKPGASNAPTTKSTTRPNLTPPRLTSSDHLQPLTSFQFHCATVSSSNLQTSRPTTHYRGHSTPTNSTAHDQHTSEDETAKAVRSLKQYENHPPTFITPNPFDALNMECSDISAEAENHGIQPHTDWGSNPSSR